MLTINLDTDLDAAAAELPIFFRREVPFAASRTMNETVKDIRKYIVSVTWLKSVNVRNKRFMGVAIRMKFSRKDDLEAIVYDRLGREYLERLARGGVKTPRGSAIAVPVGVGRTKNGRIAKNMKPRAMEARKNHFVIKGKSGNKLLVERKGKDIVVKYAFVPKADVPKSFRFYEDAVKISDRVLEGHWNNMISRATRSTRYIG